MIWVVLGIIAGISLIIYWGKKGAAWGGLTGGIIVGLVITVIRLLNGRGFSWIMLGKATILGTIVGVLAEWLGKLSDVLGRDRK